MGYKKKTKCSTLQEAHGQQHMRSGPAAAWIGRNHHVNLACEGEKAWSIAHLFAWKEEGVRTSFKAQSMQRQLQPMYYTSMKKAGLKFKRMQHAGSKGGGGPNKLGQPPYMKGEPTLLDRLGGAEKRTQHT